MAPGREQKEQARPWHLRTSSRTCSAEWSQQPPPPSPLAARRHAGCTETPRPEERPEEVEAVEEGSGPSARDSCTRSKSDEVGSELNTCAENTRRRVRTDTPTTE